MKKVLIVDDEFLVRVGLETTIPWKENGLQVVGSARNGQEALDLFERFNPDILLTDIKMPIMNGLELIGALKGRKKTLKVFIITHYEDFNYAKEALKLGATDYIQKSDLFPENLINIIKSHIEESNVTETDSEETGSSFGPVPDNQPQNSAESSLRKLVLSEYSSAEELDSLIKSYKDSFREGEPIIVLTIKRYLQDFKKEHSLSDINKSFENFSKNILYGNFTMNIFFNAENEVLYTICVKEPLKNTDIFNSLTEFSKQLKKNLLHFLDIDILIGISDISTNVLDIPRLVRNSQKALEFSYFSSSGIGVYTESPPMEHLSCPNVDASLLKDFFISGSINRVNNYVDSIFNDLAKIENIDFVKSVFYKFLTCAKTIIFELNLQDKSTSILQMLSTDNFDKLSGFNAVRKYATYIYLQISHINFQYNSRYYSYPIKKCIEYIKNNFSKNITLSDAAEYTRVSKSYLSTLFKQETGINFISFLTNYRMEKAKQLLKGSKYKIYEIAELVGFDNPYYFSKVFKDTLGISCKAFRQSSLENISAPTSNIIR